MNVTAAIIGGLIGGAAMLALLYPARSAAPDQMRMDFLKMVGMMLVPAGAAAYVAGFAIHAMMSVVFGIAHGALIQSVNVTATAGLAWGALFGFAHAVVVGAMMGVMPMMHPRMRPEHPKMVPAFEGIATSANQEDLLEPPGFFLMNYPVATIVGFVALHIMFGVIVGVVYGAAS
jgi:hypothetical protein